MPRGHPISNRSNNWNERWLPYLRRIACNILSSYPNSDVDRDDLVNAAWINSVRRLAPDTPISIVGAISRRSMFQHLLGRRRHGVKQNRITLKPLPFDGSHAGYLTAASVPYSYDDVDQVLTFVRCLDHRARFILLSKLKGISQRTIAQCLHVSEGRITQIINRDIRPHLSGT